MIFYNEYLTSKLGCYEIKASKKGLISVQLVNAKKQNNPSLRTKDAARQLQEYFIGKRKSFDLDFDLEEYSDFYKSVWNALLTIPYGQTTSYLAIAKILNNPKAVRAVGMANGKNPIGIIIPCHRVIGSDGSMTGYASGIDIKRKLLALENPSAFAEQKALF